MRRGIMLRVGVVLALAVSLGLWGTALAHAHLVSAVPAAGARLTAAPTTVTLVFSEEVSDKESDTFFTVADSKGTKVGSGKLDTTDLDHKTQSGTLQSGLGDGVYTVAWHSVTSDDNGVSSGTFTFGVNADPGTQSNTEGEEQEATTAPTTAATVAATRAPQSTSVTAASATTQPTSAAQPTATVAGVTTTLPNTGDSGSSLPVYILLLALLALITGVALRYTLARVRR